MVKEFKNNGQEVEPEQKDLLEIYNMAVEVPYSFLYVKLNAKSKKDMFYINFNQRIQIDN